ncbi:MAG: head completion protein [Verrucomicrobia bacterium]|nr:head completion protein [Verrucomicrobiota bacterium]
MSKFAKGKFTPKNPQKYVGNTSPTYRSSWEWAFMNFCDSNPNIKSWASEAVKIPYRNPITGRQTIYVPDFFIQYMDKKGRLLSEIIEIKPSSQQLIEKVGRNSARATAFAVNQAKWAAAHAWCKNSGLKFRVLNETDIFHQGGVR